MSKHNKIIIVCFIIGFLLGTTIIQRLKIINLESNNKEDIEMRNLYGTIDKLSVINSTKSRKETEKLLKNVITDYGYMLEVFRDTSKLP